MSNYWGEFVCVAHSSGTHVSLLRLSISSFCSCWLIIIITINPNLHRDLWDFIRTTCEKEKEHLGSVWLMRPKGIQMMQYVILSARVQAAAAASSITSINAFLPSIKMQIIQSERLWIVTEQWTVCKMMLGKGQRLVKFSRRRRRSTLWATISAGPFRVYKAVWGLITYCNIHL